jgi:hypothetical protein
VGRGKHRSSLIRSLSGRDATSGVMSSAVSNLGMP